MLGVGTTGPSCAAIPSLLSLSGPSSHLEPLGLPSTQVTCGRETVAGGNPDGCGPGSICPTVLALDIAPGASQM